MKRHDGWARPTARGAVAFALASLLAAGAAGTAEAAEAAMAIVEAGPVAIVDRDEITAPINVNTAPEDELVRLPGIGPAKARAIAAYRAKRPFRTVNDLLHVKGIGREMLKRMRPYVTVDDDLDLGGTTKAAPAGGLPGAPAAAR